MLLDNLYGADDKTNEVSINIEIAGGLLLIANSKGTRGEKEKICLPCNNNLFLVLFCYKILTSAKFL